MSEMRWLPGLVMILCACTAKPVLRTDPQAFALGKALVEKAIDAQGGMSSYRDLGGVRLHMHATGPYYPTDADYVFDPVRNRGAMRRVDSKGHTIEWRYDGKQGGELIDGHCTSSPKRGRFVSGLLSNLLFWIGTPWKFLDQGAHVVAVDPAPLEQGARASPRFFVTYKDVGETPDDWFLVWLDPDTFRLQRITYLVSGFTKLLEMQGEWTNYVYVNGFGVAGTRSHHPKNGFWHALAPKVIHTTSAITTHEALTDALFATDCAH